MCFKHYFSAVDLIEINKESSLRNILLIDNDVFYLLQKMSFAGMTMNVNADSPPVTPTVSGFHTVYKQVG